MKTAVVLSKPIKTERHFLCEFVVSDWHAIFAASSPEAMEFFDEPAYTEDQAKAITLAFKPTRLNYECLGNSLAHIHWHVIPRYAWDPEPTQPIWIRPKEERQTGVEPDILRNLICKPGEQLKR